MSRNQLRKGGSKRGRADEWAADMRNIDTLHNEALEKYYRGNVVPEEDWNTFLACLQTSLPLSVRLNISPPFAAGVDEYLISHLSAVFETHRLPFYPNGMAIQCGVSRGDLKRNSEYKSLKRMVSALNEGGYLTRQETVSMLPPLLLQVQPGHRVLDMCAAPGSKTSQLLERVLPNPSNGVVVANDVNHSRLDVLHHQTNRAAGAHPHLIITNYDATRFPIPASQDKFDRVLCDVMCSGDGTLRKSMDMWPRWSTVQGADLHVSQCRVLMRGMACCKKGGIVVYSTCSMNPVEDEAVISTCLAQANGHFRLIDPDSHLPGLKSVPGMTSWTITTKDLTTTMRTYEDAKVYMEAQQSAGQKCFNYKPTMFANSEVLREQNIQYARRILPHLQDTGGFFVAAMECMEEMPDKPTAQNEGESPIRPLSDTMRATAQRVLNLPDSFPYDHLLFRTESTREQKLYYANRPAMDLSSRLGSRVVHVGSKIIEASVKYSNEHLRFTVEGAANVAPLLPSSHLVRAGPETVLALAHDQPMTVSEFAERVGRSVDDLRLPSVVLECKLPTVGLVHLAVERSSKLGKMVAKVPEWQVVLCKEALGLPLVAPHQGDANGKEDDNEEEAEVNEG